MYCNSGREISFNLLRLSIYEDNYLSLFTLGGFTYNYRTNAKRVLKDNFACSYLGILKEFFFFLSYECFVGQCNKKVILLYELNVLIELLLGFVGLYSCAKRLLKEPVFILLYILSATNTAQKSHQVTTMLVTSKNLITTC